MEKEKQAEQQEKPSTAMGWFIWAKEQGYPWADAAIKNCKIPNRRCYSLIGALERGFLWMSSLEGHEHWEKIYHKLLGL